MKTIRLITVLAVFLFCACQKEGMKSDISNEYASFKESLWMIKTVGNPPATKATGEIDKFWQAGSTIRLKFLNGDAALQSKVMQYGALWLEFANLNFQYVSQTDSADVKISFDRDEKYISWATIGTDCKAIPQDESSLNFYGLAEETESGIKAEVLRGFGHILGLGFEHRNPGSPLVFADEMDVADEYGLSATEVEQLINLYSTDQTNYTDYDKASIMTIAIPRALLTKETKIHKTNRNTELSDTDKSFITGIYPFPVEKGDTLVVMKTTGIKVYISFSLTDSVKINWGDGTFSDINDANILDNTDSPMTIYSEFQHQYKDSKERTIVVYGKDKLSVLITIADSATHLDFHWNPNIKKVAFTGGFFDSIDLSLFTDLEELHCMSNNLITLDLSKNIHLKSLFCDDNKIQHLDLSNNPALEFIGCIDNQLTELDLTHNPNLKECYCYSNRLKNIDLSHNPYLTHLLIEHNELTALDLSKNPKLIYFRCHDNQILSLTLNNPELIGIECQNNRLSTLDISSCANLENLKFSNNLITEIDLNACHKLTNLICTDNLLNSLRLPNNQSIHEIECQNNRLTTLEIYSCADISTLNCSNNFITEINLQACPGLMYLICDGNLLNSLSIPNGQYIQKVECQNNRLSTLDISSCTDMEELNFSNNLITEINLSTCQNLKNLICNENLLNSLSIPNNFWIQNIVCQNNPFQDDEIALRNFAYSLPQRDTVNINNWVTVNRNCVNKIEEICANKGWGVNY